MTRLGVVPVVLAIALVGLIGCAASAPADLAAFAPAAGSTTVSPAAGSTTVSPAPATGVVAMARGAVLAHAPYKQFRLDSGAPDRAIGRTPAAACDALLFLTEYLERFPRDREARAKRDELAAWVVGLQAETRRRTGIAGVPSTPDAAPPGNRYYYAIDAVLCGRAFLALGAASGDGTRLQAARGFGDVLLHLADRQREVFARTPSGGFCEYARLGPDGLAYNCDSHVKTLLALGFLKDLSARTGDQRYLRQAETARRFLLPGLAGGWEFARAAASIDCTARCVVAWGRVPGPFGEADRFAYGDTLAYALAGLHAFEGPSETVRRLYRQFTGYRGAGPRGRAFDGRIAWPGYVDVAGRSPDEASAYYDLVTVGILSPLRRDVAPADDALAWSFVDRLAASGPIAWGVGFDGNRRGIRQGDITTLATLGAARLERGDDTGG